MRNVVYRFGFVLICVCLGIVPGFCAERNIQISSDGAGGGNLAVRVSYPDSIDQYRFSTGSPVLVSSPGGHQPGFLDPGSSWIDYGFTIVTFIYPGGSDGPFSSDGTYDYRGENCILALRDVIRYAMGEHQDIMGNTIQDLFPGNLLLSNIGIVSGSNGGPTTTATLSLHSGDLQGVKYLVHMESPTSDQTVNGDLGAVSYDCFPYLDGDGNGLPGDDGKNVNYTTYGPSTCQVDYSHLAWESSTSWTYTDAAGLYPPVQISGTVFLDNNLNGTLDSTGTPPCYDINGNGILDQDEDYPFASKITFIGPGTVKVYLSTEVTGAADISGIFPGQWPDHIALPVESDLFWNYRDATLHFDTVSTEFPDIAVMLTFSETDHVQSADDHPHIQQSYDGYRRNSIWCRLNPDLAYIEYTEGGSAPPGTKDNDANTPVLPGNMKQYANPDNLNFFEAGACEMADRVFYAEWELNLDNVLSDATPTPAPTWTPVPPDWPPLYIVSMMHAEESLPFHTDETIFTNHATRLRELSDLLVSHGAKLDFGPDWTFIEGVKQFDPTLLTDLLAAGHGVQTHAHESLFDLGQVNAKLLEAGLTENCVSNGGFLKTGSGGTNWVGYVADFEDNEQNRLFRVSAGYKNSQTQEIYGIGHVFRPSKIGDWTVPDPDGPITYIGCNMPVIEGGGGGLDFDEIRDWIDEVLTRIDPEKVNTLYWHDSLHKYGNPAGALERMDLWESLLSEHLDPLVAAGRIEWRNFTEIDQIYRDMEQSWTPTPTPTPTQTSCTETGVTIRMPSNMFSPGDACWCNVMVCNSDVSALENHPLFVILDVYGSLYFAPSFNEEFDSFLADYPEFISGETEVVVLPEFEWPAGVGSASGITWLAAITDPTMVSIVGSWDSMDFGWDE
ncbi:hypothetical protein K8T06_17045 [bacterium]|nr:hypothetical protein [bacterium]